MGSCLQGISQTGCTEVLFFRNESHVHTPKSISVLTIDRKGYLYRLNIMDVGL